MLIANLSKELVRLQTSLQDNLPFMLKILAGMWLIHLINWLIGYKLNYLGIKPRHLMGLPGILFSSFLHANFQHIFFNSIPFFCLGIFIMHFGLKFYFSLSISIILIEGILTWILGRNGNHIGASSLIAGYFAVVLMQAYTMFSLTTLLLASITLYYFGSILLSLVPSKDQISWESHLFGFLAGIISIYSLPWL